MKSHLANLLPSIADIGILGTSASGSITCGIAGAIAAFFLVKLSQPSKLDHIPTVGSTSWLGSWLASLRFLTKAPDIIKEGYEKHNPRPFKVAEPRRWIVVLTNCDHVEEVRCTREDTLSMTEAKNDIFQNEYTLGPGVFQNAYHIPIVSSQLTRSIGALFPEIRDEIVTTFEDVLGLKGNEWKSVPVLSSIQQVVSRTSNRVFVGLPLCRDPGWIDLTIHHTLDFFTAGAIIGSFPKFLKPMAARFLTKVRQHKQRGVELLGPIIEKRQKCLEEHGSGWVDKPNDFLSWLMDVAEGPELTANALTARLFAVNFAAIHTSSNSFTLALFYLAANPEYIQPLREEVETIIVKEGWSKAALGKMRKIDSFLKECQRFEGIFAVSLGRKAMKDFTFSDGTFVPKGTTLLAASQCIHRDEALYEDAHVFKPFRFAELREEDGDTLNHQFVTTTTKYLPFGHGRRACPGRFFAANELKAMLAHVVTTYDIKFPDGATRPQSQNFMVTVLPDKDANIMFRRRAEQ